MQFLLKCTACKSNGLGAAFDSKRGVWGCGGVAVCVWRGYVLREVSPIPSEMGHMKSVHVSVVTQGTVARTEDL
jgi:hypothetical protein